MSDMDAFWRAFWIAMGATAGIGWALLAGVIVALVITWVGGMVRR